MNDTSTASLQPEDLNRVTDDMAEAIPACLNLPPVGYIDDRRPFGGPDDLSAFVLPPEVRRVLGERRRHIGRFSSPADLCGMAGFGPSDLDALIELLSDLPRFGNRVRPVWGGPESNREFFALLEGAQRSIHISTYIIGGETGLRLARLLARKHKEGVKVRIMFCATGFVISGSPSGTGFVSRCSELRSWLLNDMYVRRRIVRELQEAGVPFINTAPIGRHWRRRDFRKNGISTPEAYERWIREQGIPDDWAQEQARIDEECAFGFSNVDHRKMIIVDGDRAFIGSQNLADSYFYDNELSDSPLVNRRNWQWHDNSAILEGGAVRELSRLFAMRWTLSGGDRFDWTDSFYSPLPRRMGHAAVTVEATIPGGVRLPLKQNWKGFVATFFGGDVRPVSVGTNPVKERLLSMVHHASSDFYVEHCYPADADLLTRWAVSAARVPSFHMVVPLHYDTILLGTECDRYFPELAEAGVQLHGFNRAILHSKILVMDGFYVATGSYNLNLRSARADLENEFFIQCAQYGGAVRDRIRNDLEWSIPVAPSALDRYRSRRSIPVLDALLRYLLL